jgi:lipopolysaccharide transport system ATP-binding protein
MTDLALRADGLGKRYRLGRRQRYRTLRDTLAEGVTSPFRAAAGALRRSRLSTEDETDVIWALKDASFEVEPGEVVGIIGRNGSGKSTLLKVLSRITDPTTGSAEVRGRVGALLEVGVGFHPELTGRENVFLSGAVLGMTRAEVLRKFDEIVEFSGNARFLDTPVKHYSSGMYLRLAFAVAAHLELEILLVDEVLAVGDIAFQERCLRKMDEVSTSGRTVLFVSHNLAAVRTLCSRAILLTEGRIHREGTTDEVIDQYLRDSRGMARTDTADLSECRRHGSGAVRATRASVSSAASGDGYLATDGDATFTIHYRARESDRIPMLHVGVIVVDSLGTTLFSCSTSMVGRNFRNLPASGRIVCKIDRLPLISGSYSAHVSLKDAQSQADYVYDAIRFMVVNQSDHAFIDHPGARAGSIAIAPTWASLDTDGRPGPA